MRGLRGVSARPAVPNVIVHPPTVIVQTNALGALMYNIVLFKLLTDDPYLWIVWFLVFAEIIYLQ